jgi:hypothetical protein
MMKTLKFAIYLTFIVIASSQSTAKSEFAVLEAIKGILRNHFATHEQKIDLIFNGPNSENLAEGLLRGKPEEVSCRVISLDQVDEIQPDFPSIILFDSFEYLKQTSNKIKEISEDGVWHNHLLYVPKGNFDIIEILTQKNIVKENHNFISVVNDTTVDLVTGFRFLPGVCSSAVYKTINRFSTDAMTWHNKTFFPDKYRNFHGCPLRVGQPADTSTVTGQKIFELLAQRLNFEQNLIQISNYTYETDKFDVIELLTLMS